MTSAPVVASAPPPASSAPPPAAAPAAPASARHDSAASRPVGHVYRFDFTLLAKDGSQAPTTSFTLNLEEGRSGEVVIGKNIALTTPGTPGTGIARQDVGVKVVVDYRTTGDDVLLDVHAEVSAADPPTSVRKLASRSSVLASAGKATLVLAMDDDKKHYELNVTPTKLR